MSGYKNATRFLLPLLNKNLKHKNISTWWNIKTCRKYQSTNSSLYYANSILKQQVRSIHLSGSVNKIISFNLSDIGEGIREVVVKEWFVKEGDKVAQFDQICEVQSDKASVTITSRYDGIVTKLYHAVDEIALVGNALVDIDTQEDENEAAATEKTPEKEEKIEAKEEVTIKPNSEEKIIKETLEIPFRGVTIPSVRRIAKENNINLTQVKGTGKDGRILKEDILNFMKSQKAGSVQDEVRIEPVRGYTRTMIRTMTEAMKVPHFVYHDEIKVSNLVKLREKLKRKSQELDVKITYLPFFLKAVSNGLGRFPVLNASLDEKQENITYYKSHNIGVAMDTPTGLAVPVIRNVESKDVIQISKEIMRLQVLGKQSKFSQNDLSGGTFSFSNIGAIGGTYASPIILPPQSAIVALGAFKTLPMFADDGSIIKETIAYFSGSADHRIVDGATMARFCNVLKEQIENPEFLFLNV